jgi:hypothetical protein
MSRCISPLRAGFWEAAMRSITRLGIPPSNGNVVLLYAVDADNVSIEGPGTIDGQGGQFYTGKGDNTGPGGNAATGYKDRPHLLVFYHCRNLGSVTRL